MKILWFIPTHGDSRYLGTTHGARAATFDYFKQIAVAADSLGYEGVLLPTGRSCEDPWIVAASLIDATRHLKFLVALRPGLVQPSQSARMAATFDRLSGGRLLVNLVTGGDADELSGDGQFLGHAERYEQSAEFIRIWRDVLARSHAGEAFDFDGKHLQVRGAKLLYPPVSDPYPPVFFGGSSEAGHELAATDVDTYLSWGEPPAAIAAKVADVKARAARHGRTLSFGIRLHVIVRETEGEAWRAAAELISHLDEKTVAAAQAKFGQMDSVGQRRMADLHKGRFDKADVRGLEIAPNLWAGVGLVRGGAGTALVGNPEQVAARIEEYAALGLEYFIFSGYPHLEEAHRFAELVFPLLPLPLRRQLAARTLTGPFGEIVANTYARVRPRRVRPPRRRATSTRERAMASLGASRPESAWRQRLLPWALPVLTLIAWEIASSSGWLSKRVLPEPWSVLTAFWGLLRSGELWRHVAVSTGRALAGLAVGGGLGLMLGLLTGTFRTAETLLDTSFQMVRNIPALALIPLVILWFGIDEGAKLFLVAIGVFFPIYLNTFHGIRSVDQGLIEMARSYGLGGWQLYRHVVLPGALPSILVGLRFSLGLMWVLLIVAETISAQAGIGYLTMNAREFLQTDVVLVGILLYALLGKLADVLARGLERWWLRWHPGYQRPASTP